MVMILCLTGAHTSIFNTPRQVFFKLNERVKFLCVIRRFFLANIFDYFLFDSPSLINTNFNVLNSSF